jgi:hypothetical protein
MAAPVYVSGRVTSISSLPSRPVIITTRGRGRPARRVSTDASRASSLSVTAVPSSSTPVARATKRMLSFISAMLR